MTMKPLKHIERMQYGFWNLFSSLVLDTKGSLDVSIVPVRFLFAFPLASFYFTPPTDAANGRLQAICGPIHPKCALCHKQR